MKSPWKNSKSEALPYAIAWRNECLREPVRVDIQYPLSVSILPSKIFVLLVAACLGWIALLSAAFVLLLGTDISSGWIIAGALIAALAVWVAVMFREIRHAPDQPEYFSPEDSGGDNFPTDEVPLPTAPLSGFTNKRAAKANKTRRHPALGYQAGFRRSAGSSAYKNR